MSDGADPHDHDDHDHVHDMATGHAHHPAPLSPVEARVAAIESVLVEHGMFDTDRLDAIVANFEHNLGPLNGARVVARAWVDPDYKARLLADGDGRDRRARLRRAGGRPHGGRREHAGRAQPRRLHVVLVLPVADARPAAHVVQVACVPVACSARAACPPRRDGHALPDDVSIRVWDSSAEVRYLVLPERPPGTDDYTEEDLAALVTRDSMIGVQRL